MKSDKVRYVVTNAWQESITSIFLASFWGKQVQSTRWQLPVMYRMSLKLYEKFQGWLLHIKQRKNSYKRKSRNGWFLSFTEKFYSTIHALTMLYFTCNRHNKLTVNFPNLITVEFLWSIEPQFTVFKLPCTWINAGIDTSDHGLLHDF